ncbi:phage major capsid protein, P2 family [Achromobacter sp. UMC71]|uniref:phage major capsid protein, P2 family n=1 Tax=Achromobacter sp. UMC71 TaxID=1862320 RepID=UPI0015FF9BC0|nr:phage major capsid protein, P2 family [Achromobacter sp. UMC71]MBB1625171.1 phage major capsid protein, P2 family [Achromobacter sp. UMC71]
MREHTRTLFTGYMGDIAKLNGTQDASKSFNVSLPVQITMETKIQESSAFLKLINILPVTDQIGQKMGLGVSGPSAGRTNTETKARQTRDLTKLDPNGYQCIQTNFDSHIKFAMLDAWARFKDFQLRIRNAIIQRQALDRIMIGFNGVSAAADTDINTNPLLQDVNKGWLQQLRERAPERVLNKGKDGGTVKIGVGGDYRNLDAAVFDLGTLLDPWFHGDTQLVALVSRDTLHDKYFPLVNGNDKPTEKLATDIIVSQKRLGNVQAVAVPYMPVGTVLLTRYDNLSIYPQEGGRRRHVKEAPERDRVEFYESSNDAYVIEDFGCAALLENIELLPDPEPKAQSAQGE